MPGMCSGCSSSTDPVVCAPDSRKRMALATSSGLQIRPSVEALSACLSQSSPWPRESCSACSLAVEHQPMFRALTRIPSRPRAAALLRVSVRRPPLDAAYAMQEVRPPLAWTEATLTIAPPRPWRRMMRATACVKRKGARRLTACSSSQSAAVVSSISARRVSPAAFTRASMRPNLASAASTAAEISAGDLTSHRTNRHSQLSDSSAAAAAPLSPSRSTRQTPEAPHAAARRAVASPSPCAAPVISTTRPAMSPRPPRDGTHGGRRAEA
mmetsp:Transcript_308/g.952  ORF Transcript_308/g.952 Transcript_308/m.952 type:complete len:269 (+) Transcript_308:84-890(+)